MKTRLQLFILYLLITGVLLLRISTESTAYSSPDSAFYLRAATNMLEGKGLVAPTVYPFQQGMPESYLAIWPVGYPVGIALVAAVTGLDPLISSKILNATCLALIFVLLYHWFREHSLLPCLYFCSFSMLEVYAYTWSEGAFLFFLLFFLFLLEKVLRAQETRLQILLMAVSMVLMVLLRYAGLIYLIYVIVLTITMLCRQRFYLARKLGVVGIISGTVVFIYLLNNYFQSGGFFGNTQRIFPEQESWLYFFKLLFVGLSNEFFIARNFYWEWDWLFVMLLCLQLLVTGYFFTQKKRLRLAIGQDVPSLTPLLSSVFYLLFMIVLRKLSPFDAFDYRILAPFSAPLFILVLGSMRIHQSGAQNSYVRPIIVCFFLLSLVMNLPKKFLLDLIGLNFVC